MSVELKEINNLKIVPKNYESGTLCQISEIANDRINLILPFIKEDELKDYEQGSIVELFGLHKNGLVYFTSEIFERNQNELLINMPNLIREIQRRKYSRVPFDGKLILKNNSETEIIPKDISAGGVRFYSSKPFMFGDEFEIRIELANNLIINCSVQPIRIEEIEGESNLPYSVSAKFRKIRSIDRIALMQYSLRLLSEMQNKN